MSDSKDHDLKTAQALGQVQGELKQILQAIHAGNDAMNKRLDDLKESVNTRMDTHEERISNLEEKERSTAIKVGVAGALAGAIASVGVEFAKHALRVKGGG